MALQVDFTATGLGYFIMRGELVHQGGFVDSGNTAWRLYGNTMLHHTCYWSFPGVSDQVSLLYTVTPVSYNSLAITNVLAGTHWGEAAPLALPWTAPPSSTT
jgi:hypothetical protein